MGIYGEILGFGDESLLAIVVPLGAVMLAFWFLIVETQKKSRRPFSGNPLRPPGESARLKTDALGEQILTRLMFLTVVLIPSAWFADGAFHRRDRVLAWSAIGLSTVLALGLLLWVWQIIKKWRNYALGFDGERAVGEELNRLMLDGCQVFHDLAMEKRGNIDHIVVAPHAVFAIETKAYRKSNEKIDGKEQHRVTFTGSELEFPNRRSSRELKQARSNAKALSEKLSRLTAEQVVVKPVLVICGWYVNRTGKGDVTVVNDDLRKELRPSIVDTKAKPMDSKQRQRIVELLEQWSRDSMAKGQ